MTFVLVGRAPFGTGISSLLSDASLRTVLSCAWLAGCGPNAGYRKRTQKDEDNCESEHGIQVANVVGCKADADDRDAQAHVGKHEVSGDDRPSILGRGEATGGGQTAHEDGANGGTADDGSHEKEGQGGRRYPCDDRG